MEYSRDICILSQEDLIRAGCFDMSAAVAVCEDALTQYANGTVIFPDKVSVIFNEETQDRINCLPAGLREKNVYGMKWVSVFPENPHKRDLPNLSAVVILSEMSSGFPVAFMEATLCSNMRTAAMSALAARHLCVDDPKTIGFIGAGDQAKSHFLAMKSVFPGLKTCKVSSRTAASEERFIRQMRGFHPQTEWVACAGNHQLAAQDADIIVTAISGQEKILQAHWIKDGAFYCHVGGLEDDFSVAQKASKIVCDAWDVVKHRTQTISQMHKQGLLSDDRIYADLHEIVTGKKPGRENKQEFIYYNGVGLSYVDVALANWMYETATQKGIGRRIPLMERSMFDSPQKM